MEAPESPSDSSSGLLADSIERFVQPTLRKQTVTGMPAALIDRLSANGLAINDEELDGKAVRFVAAWNTTESEVDALLAVLSDHCASI